MEKKLLARNIFCTVLLQLVTILSGFVVPKIVLLYFGSETNGLVSSLNQFLNYIALLEGGMSGVIMSSLYKPLRENDWKKVSGIVRATERFFRQIGMIYIVYMLAVAFVYPAFVRTHYSYSYVAVLTVVLGMNLFLQYFFSLSYKVLLNASRKVYFVSLTQIVLVLLNMLLVVVTAVYFRDILLLKLFGLTIYIVQPLVYGLYVKKHYPLDKTIPSDNTALKQRWDGFGQNLAYFIHVNTDVVVLTLFATLTDVSIYSVYLLIVNALKNLVVSVSSAIGPSLGNVLAGGDEKRTNAVFDLYEFGTDVITTILFSCGAVLITAFVGVYTANITDANYIQYGFGILLTLAEMVYCFRDPYVNMAYTAGRFRQTAPYAYVEAAMNIVLSVLLVRRFGLIGVAIGTLISMVYRMFAHVWYLKREILHRNPMKFIKKLSVFGVATLLTFLTSNALFSMHCSGYAEWALLGIGVLTICCTIVAVLCVAFFRAETCYLAGIIWKKVMRKN
jgi:O-antigen/teichoic acid export membrane protein